MRIIRGTLRGKNILPPPAFKARPTTDFARESLFNILENRYDFTTLRVLDLFAGTGSISYELASRGCPHIDTVEMNALHHAFIKKTAQQLQLPAVHAVRMNVFDFIPLCSAQYGLVFADPPYDLPGIDTLPERILEKNLLQAGGCFILEHPARYDFSEQPCCTEHRRYGAVNFSFFIPQ